MNKIICPECKKKIDSNSKKCKSCGFKIHPFIKVKKVISNDVKFITKNEENKLFRANLISFVFFITLFVGLVGVINYDKQTGDFSFFIFMYSLLSLIIIRISTSPIRLILCEIEIDKRNKISEEKSRIDEEDKQRILNELKENGLICEEEFPWSVTKKENCEKYTIYIDFSNKKFAIVKYNFSLIDFLSDEREILYIINFDELIKFDIKEDNSTIHEGGIGRALVGGALAGSTGAIVGATTRKSKDVVNSLYLRIITKQASNTLIILDFLETDFDGKPFQRDSSNYRVSISELDSLYALFVKINSINNNNISVNNISKDSDSSIENKLDNLQKLLNKNLITKEDYEKKKNSILEEM